MEGRRGANAYLSMDIIPEGCTCKIRYILETRHELKTWHEHKSGQECKLVGT